MKKVFVISAVMLIAISAVIISCKNKNSDNPTNGCVCRYYDSYYGSTETWEVDLEDLLYEGVSSCSAMAASLNESNEVSNATCWNK